MSSIESIPQTDRREVRLEVTETVTPDGGWGWVVVLSGFIAHVITHGILYSFGIIFIALQDSFHSDKADTSWIGSLASGMLYLTGPLSGYLTGRFGCRPVAIGGALIAAAGNIISVFANSLKFLYFSMGIVTGFGYGLVFLPTIVVVSQYFDKRRSIACSIALSGAGSGAFIFNPITKYLLQWYGWRGTLLIEAGVVLNCVICGQLYRPLEVKRSILITKDTHEVEHLLEKPLDRYENIRTIPKTLNGVLDDDNRGRHGRIPLTCTDHTIVEQPKNGTNCERLVNTRSTKQPHNSDWKRHFSIFKDQIFLLFAMSQFLFFFGFYLPFVYLPDKSQLSGIESGTSAWVVSTIGIASVAGRLLFGYIADKPTVNRLLLFNISFLISGVSTALGPLYTLLPVLFVYAGVYGAFTGVTLALTSVILADLLGIERLADAFGMNNLFTGIAVFIGPPISGWIFDVTGSYDISFIVSGVSMATGAAIMFLTPILKRRQV